MLRHKALSVVEANRRECHKLDPTLEDEATLAVEAGLSNGVVGKMFEIDREIVQTQFYSTTLDSGT
jgi:hypothetical protein